MSYIYEQVRMVWHEKRQKWSRAAGEVPIFFGNFVLNADDMSLWPARYKR